MTLGNLWAFREPQFPLLLPGRPSRQAVRKHKQPGGEVHGEEAGSQPVGRVNCLMGGRPFRTFQPSWASAGAVGSRRITQATYKMVKHNN